ncbi:MAG: hypothetical protein OER97_03175 [Gammaproteobacteria bacterium]|nr:hypothetical protein [Gammaproteobacteria bacterium]
MNTRRSVTVGACMLVLGIAAMDNAFAQSGGNSADQSDPLPAIDDVAISPDGQTMAYVLQHEGQPHLAIDDLSGGKVLVPPIENLEFRWLRWANNDRLVFALQFPAKRGFAETQETRLLGIDKDGANVVSIIKNATRVELGSHISVDVAPPQIQDDVIDWLPDDPDHILISLDADHDDRNEVRRVDVNSGQYDTVQVGLPGIQHHVADHNDEVRFGWGLRRDNRVAWYKRSDGDWVNVSNADWWLEGFMPVAFDDEADVALLQGPGENGRLCIRRANLVTGELLETVFKHDAADVDGIILEPNTRRAIGFRYTDKFQREQFSDEQMSALQRTIATALPDAASQIASWSRNRRQLIVFVESVDDSGAFYLWDRDMKSFELLGKKISGS